MLSRNFSRVDEGEVIMVVRPAFVVRFLNAIDAETQTASEKMEPTNT